MANIQKLNEIVERILWEDEELDVFIAQPKLVAELTKLIDEETTKARIDELEIIDDKLYDISSTEWGIPTKWSKEKYGKENYADLWSPNEAIHEVVKNRLTELKERENSNE